MKETARKLYGFQKSSSHSSPLIPRRTTNSISFSTIEEIQRKNREMFANKSSQSEIDESESRIWSPLVPLGPSLMSSASVKEMQRKLAAVFDEERSSFEYGYSKQSRICSAPLISCVPTSVSGFSMELRRKLSDGLDKISQEKLHLSSKIQKKMTTMKKKKISATPVKGSTPKKGWTKVLKAASKPFKKQGSCPKHVKLQDFLRSKDF